MYVIYPFLILKTFFREFKNPRLSINRSSIIQKEKSVESKLTESKSSDKSPKLNQPTVKNNSSKTIDSPTKLINIRSTSPQQSSSSNQRVPPHTNQNSPKKIVNQDSNQKPDTSNTENDKNKNMSLKLFEFFENNVKIEYLHKKKKELSTTK